MTILQGSGFVSFIDHAFTANLEDVIAEPTQGFFNVITGGTLRPTGAATLLTIRAAVASYNVKRTDTDIMTFDCDDGEQITLPVMPLLNTDGVNDVADSAAGTPLDIVGGAGSCVLNGTIYYQTWPLAAA